MLSVSFGEPLHVEVVAADRSVFTIESLATGVFVLKQLQTDCIQYLRCNADIVPPQHPHTHIVCVCVYECVPTYPQSDSVMVLE